jgi:murein DD-endopeptidase MepM/ murein hydrolase activator NlpD
MKIQKTYSFLFIPDGDGRTREWRVPTALLAVGAVALVLLLVMSGLYVADWIHGSAWRPGGAPIVQENVILQRQVAAFETRVEAMQQDLDEVFAYQQALAAAVDITPLDVETRAAGIGGRQALSLADELTGLKTAPQLDALLRQSRIQRAGMAALLDSLSSRRETRDSIPSIRPCDIGWLSSRYGKRRDPFTGRQAFHRGIDFSLPVGTPVRVTAAGKVVKVEKQRGLGRVVKVDHGNGLLTVYAHLQEAKVEVGQDVARGDVIALSGNSGRSTAPHLHYEVRVSGRSVNPLTYILDTYASRS